MPELPEVETLKRQLKLLQGKKIKTAIVKWPKMVAPLSVAKFITGVKGRKITKVDRRAKMLVFYLDDGWFLVVHLKMTGQLVYKKIRNQKNKKLSVITGGHPQKIDSDELPNKFTHIVLEFSDGSKLFFNDMRKFGWMRLVDGGGLKSILDKYGVEPLLAAFTYSCFKEKINKYPNRKLKQTLLDQSLISGLGNIYVDEACFCAKVMPTRNIVSLKESEIKRLYNCIKKILKLAVAKKGTSFNTYVHSDGNKGNFVAYLKVYGRKGENCFKCHNIIHKIKVNGRGTHFCPICQK